MPLRSLPLQIVVVSLIVPIFTTVFLVYQASVRWTGFKGVIKEDWEINFRADTTKVEAWKRPEMGGKTPVYLYVWICLSWLALLSWGLYQLTRMK